MTLNERVVSTAVVGLLAVGGALEIALPLSRPSAPELGARAQRSARIAQEAARDTVWIAHVGVVDRALARGDISAAVRAWHDAYGAALAAGSWDA